MFVVMCVCGNSIASCNLSSAKVKKNVRLTAG